MTGIISLVQKDRTTAGIILKTTVEQTVSTAGNRDAAGGKPPTRMRVEALFPASIARPQTGTRIQWENGSQMWTASISHMKITGSNREFIRCVCLLNCFSQKRRKSRQ